MGKCRNCGSAIENNEKYCPVCGILNPIRVKREETVNDTSYLDPVEPDFALYHQRARTLALVFFALLGFAGGGFFYLGHKKLGWIWAVVHALFIIGFSILAQLAFSFAWWQAGLIVFGVLELVNLGLGLYYCFAHDVKDAAGEFLK